MPQRRNAGVDSLTLLRDRGLTIGQFLTDEGVPDEIMAYVKEGINAAFDRGDAKGLQMALRDLGEWAAGLPSHTQRKLDDLLRARFGKGLSEDTDESNRQIAAILERGTIADDNEYRLLSSKLNSMSRDSSPTQTDDDINRLLKSYDRR